MNRSISRRDLPLMRLANKCGDGAAVCQVVACGNPADYMAAPIGSTSIDTWVDVCIGHAARIKPQAVDRHNFGAIEDRIYCLDDGTRAGIRVDLAPGSIVEDDTLPGEEIEEAGRKLQEAAVKPTLVDGRPCYRCPGDGQR